MLTFKNKLITCFDIDDTIIPWSKNDQAEEKVFIECGDRVFEAQVMSRHIDNLKRHWNRGHVILVWSAGGGEWAEAVVKSLGIEKYVDLVMNKPSWYYDDKEAKDWMGKRIYLYKQPKEEEY